MCACMFMYVCQCVWSCFYSCVALMVHNQAVQLSLALRSVTVSTLLSSNPFNQGKLAGTKGIVREFGARVQHRSQAQFYHSHSLPPASIDLALLGKLPWCIDHNFTKGPLSWVDDNYTHFREGVFRSRKLHQNTECAAPMPAVFPEHLWTDYAYGCSCVHLSPECQGFSTVQPKKPKYPLLCRPSPAFENHANPLHNNGSPHRVASFSQP